MAFVGMRGTGDWGTDVRPTNFREGILYLYPNGMAPLTAIMSKMKSRKVDDPQFSWFSKSLASQAGAITGVYTDVAMAVPYVSGAVAGTTLYIKTTAAVAAEIRAGHQVLLRDSDDADVDVNAKVTASIINGAASMISCMLLENDDNSPSHDLSDADRILVIGNLNPEGGAIPDAIAYDETEYYNYTQIFRTPLEITRTARKTRLRTKAAYDEAKREALEIHSIEMEKAWIWGVRTQRTGTNGKLERTSLGLIPMIKTYASDNVLNYQTDPAFSGKTWIQGGEDWLDTSLELLFRYGRTEKMGFCGSGALLGLNKLVKVTGQIQLSMKETSYGIKITEWVTPFGTLYLKTHPLFSYEPTNRNMILILEPENLQYAFIDDTDFYKENDPKRSSTHTRIDGTKEEFLTEAGIEYHHPITFGLFNGVGLPNLV